METIRNPHLKDDEFINLPLPTKWLKQERKVLKDVSNEEQNCVPETPIVGAESSYSSFVTETRQPKTISCTSREHDETIGHKGKRDQSPASKQNIRPNTECLKVNEEEEEVNKQDIQPNQGLQPNQEQYVTSSSTDMVKEKEVNKQDIQPNQQGLQPNQEQDVTSSFTDMEEEKEVAQQAVHPIFTAHSSGYRDSCGFRLKYGNQKINNKAFSTISINANDLNRNFHNIITWLELLSYPWDIIGISETHLNSESPKLHIGGYNFISDNRQKQGGGVGLFVPESFTYKLRDDLNIQVEETETPCNTLFIEIGLKNGTNVIVGVVYKPPSVDRWKFRDPWEKVLKKIDQENKLSFIMGDFNINLFEKSKKEFMGAACKPKHYALINKVTRISENSETLIDNIYSNAPHANLSLSTTSGVLKSDVSDHFPVYQITSFDKMIKDRKDERVFVRKIGDIQTFKNKIKSYNWSSLYQLKNPNDICKKFISIFKTIYDECFPLTEDTWITDEIIKLLEEKENKYFDFLKKKTTKEKYTESRNCLEDLITETKINVLGQATKSNKPCECFEADPHEMENILNKLSDKPFINKVVGKQSLLPLPTVYMHFPDITPDEIEETAHKIISNTKPLDSEGISPQVVNRVIDYISEVLSFIFNESFRQGIFPEAMKTVKCEVVFEHGRPTETWTQSYFGELFETIARNRTIQFLKKNKLLHPSHSLLETNTSKKGAYLKSVVQSFNDKVRVFLNLEGSFSGINQAILLNKLKKYGICDTAYEWFASYLDSRYQYTQYKSSLSKCNSVSTGIPYTPIGFLLYAIFMNDISTSPVILHPDEVAIIYCSKGKKSRRKKEEKDNFNNLHKWFEDNDLLPCLAMNRCSYIRFACGNTETNPIENNTPKNTNTLVCAIKRVEETTFFGTTIDSKLISNEHAKSKSASF